MQPGVLPSPIQSVQALPLATASEPIASPLEGGHGHEKAEKAQKSIDSDKERMRKAMLKWEFKRKDDLISGPDNANMKKTESLKDVTTGIGVGSTRTTRSNKKNLIKGVAAAIPAAIKGVIEAVSEKTKSSKKKMNGGAAQRKKHSQKKPFEIPSKILDMANESNFDIDGIKKETLKRRQRLRANSECLLRFSICWVLFCAIFGLIGNIFYSRSYAVLVAQLEVQKQIVAAQLERNVSASQHGCHVGDNEEILPPNYVNDSDCIDGKMYAFAHMRANKLYDFSSGELWKDYDCS